MPHSVVKLDFNIAIRAKPIVFTALRKRHVLLAAPAGQFCWIAIAILFAVLAMSMLQCFLKRSQFMLLCLDELSVIAVFTGGLDINFTERDIFHC